MQKKILPETLNVKPKNWHSVLPPALIVSVIVLTSSLIVLSIKNVHRERNFMERALLSEALSIAHAIEATCQCGLLKETSNPAHIEAMLIELSKQPGVLYISIVKPDGTIVADGNPERIGSKLAFSVPTPRSQWHGLKTRMGIKAYEIVLRYLPSPPHIQQINDQSFFLLVGMDPRPYQEALEQDFKLTGIILFITLAVAVAGVATVLWSSLYRRTARSLKNMETLTTLIVSQMPIGLIITDIEGNIVSLNHAAESLLRIQEGENITKNQNLEALFNELKRTGILAEKELNLSFPDRKKSMVVSAFKISGGDENIAYLMLFTDVSKVKDLENKLNRNKRLAALGQLAAGLAHEVRNPLSSIKGFAKIIASKAGDDPKTQQISEAFNREVERLNRVITELLEFSKPTVISKKNVLCSQLLQEALRMVENEFAKKNIKVTVIVHPPDLEVYVDYNKMIQVLLNIFLNAADAIERDGFIDIVVEKEGDGTIIRISDTGCGIKPEHIDRLFDPYFTTKPHGVGLGLANVHKIVEAHGGKIEALSQHGKGATFIIKIPYEKSNG